MYMIGLSPWQVKLSDCTPWKKFGSFVKLA